MVLDTGLSVYEGCFLGFDRYTVDDSVYLCVWNEEVGSIADLTVCLGGKPSWTGDNCAYVNVHNLPCAMRFIEEYKLGTPTGVVGRNGYCEYPLVEFDMERVARYVRIPGEMDYQSVPGGGPAGRRGYMERFAEFHDPTGEPLSINISMVTAVVKDWDDDVGADIYVCGIKPPFRVRESYHHVMEVLQPDSE